MTVSVSPTRLNELMAYLEHVGCLVSVLGDDTIDVVVPDAPRVDAARLELDLYLRVWEARSGASGVRIRH